MIPSKNISNNTLGSKKYMATEFCQKFVKNIKLEYDKMKQSAEGYKEEFEYYTNELKDNYSKSSESFVDNKLKTLEELVEDVEMTKPIKDSIICNMKNIEKLLEYFGAFTKKTFSCFDNFDRDCEHSKVIFEKLKNVETIEGLITNLSSEHPKVITRLHNDFTKYLIEEFKPSATINHKNDEIHNFIKEFNTIEFVKKDDGEMCLISDIFATFDDFANYVWLCRDVASTNLHFEGFVKNHFATEIERILNSPLSIETSDTINNFVKFTMNFVYSLVNLLARIYGVVTIIHTIVKPSEKLIIDGDSNAKSIESAKKIVVVNKDYRNTMMYNIEKLNPFISADYHILKEVNIEDDIATGLERTKEIVRLHNSIVKPNDTFLFLGDLSESEFMDVKFVKFQEGIIEYTKKLNGRKIIIIGNNDKRGLDKFYKKCGFLEIYYLPVETDNYIFSHEPAMSPNGKLNIHGHIHGSHRYHPDLGEITHVDSFYGLHNGPIRLSDLVKYYKSGKYVGYFEKNPTWKNPTAPIKDAIYIDMKTKKMEE